MGGKARFALEAKSFDIEVEETTKGCIWERRKGVISWLKFRVSSLFWLLVGLEACDRKAWLGWWGKGPCLISEVELVRRWPITQGNVKEPFATVKMRRGL